MADGHLPVFQGLMIDRHAKRGPDLVLPGIAFADIAAVIEERTQLAGRLQVLLDAFRKFNDIRLVAGQRNDCNLNRSKIGMQMKDSSFLAAFELLLLVGVHQE